MFSAEISAATFISGLTIPMATGAIGDYLGKKIEPDQISPDRNSKYSIPAALLGGSIVYLFIPESCAPLFKIGIAISTIVYATAYAQFGWHPWNGKGPWVRPLSKISIGLGLTTTVLARNYIHPQIGVIVGIFAAFVTGMGK